MDGVGGMRDGWLRLIGELCVCQVDAAPFKQIEND